MNSSSYESAVRSLQEHIPEKLGIPVETILSTPLCELERQRAVRTEEPMVVRDDSGYTLTTEQIEEMADGSLGYSPNMVKIRSLIGRRRWLRSLRNPCH